MSRARTYTITEMAEQSGLSLRALRFYEERGILSPTRVGYWRLYDESDRKRLADIVRWRAQGFTVTEIKTAIALGGFSKRQIKVQIKHLRRQRDILDEAIKELMDLLQ